MTRLKEDDISGIIRHLEAHDIELRRQTGRTLAEIAASLAGTSREIHERIHTTPVAVIPLTTGQGIIGGFSDTCAAILRHIGMPAFVTSQPDAAGMVEAVERGAEEIFMADDLTCTMLDLPTHTSAENSACTGLGFAAALAARLGRLRGRRITVLGAGPVGSNAAEYFLERGAEVVIYDTDEAKTAAWRGRDRVCVARTSAEALALSNIYFEARTARDTIQDEDMDDATLVAAPGIPLGVSEAAMAHHGAQVIHDPLELGVASMAYVLQAKAIMAAAAVKKQIG